MGRGTASLDGVLTWGRVVSVLTCSLLDNQEICRGPELASQQDGADNVAIQCCSKYRSSAQHVPAAAPSSHSSCLYPTPLGGEELTFEIVPVTDVSVEDVLFHLPNHRF